jgi:hypothetical protein
MKQLDQLSPPSARRHPIPRIDLVRMNLMASSKLGNRRVALDGRQGNFRLNSPLPKCDFKG